MNNYVYHLLFPDLVLSSNKHTKISKVTSSQDYSEDILEKKKKQYQISSISPLGHSSLLDNCQKPVEFPVL